MKAYIVDPGETWNNYHTHTYRCDHASGDVEDYVMRASSLGMSKIGISEHAWIPGNGNQVFRMREEAVPDYVLSCRTADAAHEDVKVLCGVECDYDPSDERRIREAEARAEYEKSLAEQKVREKELRRKQYEELKKEFG